jgi:hypothetical protein
VIAVKRKAIYPYLVRHSNTPVCTALPAPDQRLTVKNYPADVARETELADQPWEERREASDQS